jgi:hypothetical protein
MNPVIRPDSGNADLDPILKHKVKTVERELSTMNHGQLRRAKTYRSSGDRFS